ncbi:CAP10 domain-containing protein [Mycena indigotica]|uniref:CAP10 domain-containing protein n=1 Tax=Mycena indigotica TaxID=2126181 RepID=A0A8H6W9G5_9AGAR|nr:CAP10 domain-containing protein [Mycena indigotica]KAF7304104.1 CAP10 domain-containing protein [Mycena indigotica]
MKTFWSSRLPAREPKEDDLDDADIPLLGHDLPVAAPRLRRAGATSLSMWALALCVTGAWILGIVMGGVGSAILARKPEEARNTTTTNKTTGTARPPPHVAVLSSPPTSSSLVSSAAAVTAVPDPEASLRAIAAASVDALIGRQSSTIAQAKARYILRNNRSPPPSFPQWFDYAHERHCLIDEYDQVYSDFKVFYDIAKEDQGYFRRMAERAARQIEGQDASISRVDVKTGWPSLHGHTAYDSFWPNTFPRFTKIFGNMTFLVNGRDEPRVAFNARKMDAWSRFRDTRSGSKPHSVESGYFGLAPSPTAPWFAEQGCELPLEREGMMKSANPWSGFMLSSVTPAFSTELYPLLSMAKVSPCFADILFPTEFYYTYSWWYQPFYYPDRVKWEDKLDKAYWRGGATSGRILDNATYHSFPRFLLSKLSKQHPSLLDARITTFPGDTHCLGTCNASAGRWFSSLPSSVNSLICGSARTSTTSPSSPTCRTLWRRLSGRTRTLRRHA